jgi:hypothetical protein
LPLLQHGHIPHLTTESCRIKHAQMVSMLEERYVSGPIERHAVLPIDDSPPIKARH